MSVTPLNATLAAAAGSDHESHGVQGAAIHSDDLLSFLAEGPFDDMAQDLVEDFYCTAKLLGGARQPEALVPAAAFDPALPGTELESPASTLSSQGALQSPLSMCW